MTSKISELDLQNKKSSKLVNLESCVIAGES